MARKRGKIPEYGTVKIDGRIYYRTFITDDDGKQRSLCALTREALYDKEMDALSEMDDERQRKKSPTLADYCEKWLVMQSAQVRTTTLTDYKSKVRRNIIPYLGDKKIAEVTLDDIQLALVPVSKKSASVYKSVIVIYKCIFRAAEESRIIKKNPTVYLSPKGGGVPQAEKQPLTDEQVQRLLDAVRGLPPYVFIMLGLYAGLRREEILGLQWDSVYLDNEAPYLAHGTQPACCFNGAENRCRKEKYPPAGSSGSLPERSKEKFDLGLCCGESGRRTAQLYAV